MGVDFSSFGIVVEEAFREAAGVAFADFKEEAELLEAVFVLRADIGGAGSSTSQLHCAYKLYSEPQWNASYPEKLSQSAVIWLNQLELGPSITWHTTNLAWLPLNIFQVLCEPKTQHLQLSLQCII
jgi:hypothetical protein